MVGRLKYLKLIHICVRENILKGLIQKAFQKGQNFQQIFQPIFAIKSDLEF